MIITRSPLRISLGGGGTDLPSYYRDHGGFVIAAAIDKHVYITVHEPFADQIILKYSQMEVVRTASDVKHPIVREAMKLVGIDGRVEYREHVRYSCRYRARLLGKFHNRAAPRSA